MTKKVHIFHAVPPRSTLPFCLQKDQKWLQNVEETMVWQSPWYNFLKSETKFEILCQNIIIWDPAMVSLTKIQLTIRQDINKVQKFHFFSTAVLFICIPCLRRLKIHKLHSMTKIQLTLRQSQNLEVSPFFSTSVWFYFYSLL